MGIQSVLQCHGSFATAYCIECRRIVPGSEIEKAILTKEVPYCAVCLAEIAAAAPTKKRKRPKKSLKPWEGESDEDEGVQKPRPSCVMKVSQDSPVGALGQANPFLQPGITFFGEIVTSRFDDLLEQDREVADLLVVIGTSLKVAPVSEILSEYDVPSLSPAADGSHSSSATFCTAGEPCVRSLHYYMRTDEASLKILINKTPVAHVNPDVRLRKCW